MHGQEEAGEDKAMAYKITVMPGDSVGPEVTNAAMRVLESTGASFQ